MEYHRRLKFLIGFIVILIVLLLGKNQEKSIFLLFLFKMPATVDVYIIYENS